MTVLAWIAAAALGSAVLLGGGALTYRTVKAQHPLEAYTLAEGPDSVRVLVAAHRTGYKDRVLALAKAELEGAGIRVDVADANSLGPDSMRDYRGLVVLSAVESGRLLPGVRKALGEMEAKDRLRLFLTADSGKWKKRELRVDAVAMASTKANEEAMAKDLAMAVRDLAR